MFNPIIAAMIHTSGRSWWQARYSSGKVLSEWGTLTDKIRLPIGSSCSSRWEEVPKENMVGLRLLCPNGMAGELEAPEGHKFFQLKVAYFDVSMFGGGSRRTTTGHVIGVVKDAEGNCLCRAWEITPESKRALQGIQTRLAAYQVGNHDHQQKEIRQLKKRIASHRYLWHLITFEDNIYQVKYENLGNLNLDVQQLKV